MKGKQTNKYTTAIPLLLSVKNLFVVYIISLNDRIIDLAVINENQCYINHCKPDMILIRSPCEISRLRLQKHIIVFNWIKKCCNMKRVGSNRVLLSIYLVCFDLHNGLFCMYLSCKNQTHLNQFLYLWNQCHYRC